MSDSYVYFIRPEGQRGPVKIGHSTMPVARVRALMTWSPVPLEVVCQIPGGAALERNLHECFSHCHSHREWFNPDAAMQEAIEKLISGVPVEQAVDLDKRQPFQRAVWKDWPGRQLHREYVAKLRGHSVRLSRKANGGGTWPQDVVGIMSRWKTWEGTVEPIQPTAAELARLDEVLARPEAHFSITWQRAG